MPSGRKAPLVSLLCSDLGRNNVIRLRPVAGALARNFRVQIVGPLFGNDEVFVPLREQLQVEAVRTRPHEEMRFADYRQLWRDISGLVRGDVLYAFKPLLASYGAALYIRRHRRRPVVLDIEDWDAAPFHELSFRGRYGRWRLKQLFRNQLDPVNARLGELFVSRADRRVVASSFLQRRYGGTRVVQGIDPTEFEPEAYDAASEREAFGLPPSTFLVLFAGTAWPHKGLPDLVEALRTLRSGSVGLVIAGSLNRSLEELLERSGDLITYVGVRPHSEMPRLLAACDAVCLPQRDTPEARAQIPAKVFEAMAMAKPVIATPASDLPEILRHCGILVPFGDSQALAGAVRKLQGDRALGRSLGRTAREQCLARYTWEAMARPLSEILLPLADR